MHYSGFSAWCAAYAFLNTVVHSRETPELYELLSGVPFGLKHRVGDPFRILTPLIEPCFRVEATSSMLGYRSFAFRFDVISEAVQFMAVLPVGNRVMLGPVDMGYLTHLPQNMYYCGQSHYISIENVGDDCFLVIDSEGVLNYKHTINSLHNILNIQNIPESNGFLNIWTFERLNCSFATNDYRKSIIRTAKINLLRAEAEGQGSQAILTCADFLVNVDINLWLLKLCYELNYLIQRKSLFLKHLLILRKECQIRIVEKQIGILCALRKCALHGTSINFDLFRRLAYHEHELANKVAELPETEVILDDIDN